MQKSSCFPNSESRTSRPCGAALGAAPAVTPNFPGCKRVKKWPKRQRLQNTFALCNQGLGFLSAASSWATINRGFLSVLGWNHGWVRTECPCRWGLLWLTWARLHGSLPPPNPLKFSAFQKPTRCRDTTPCLGEFLRGTGHVCTVMTSTQPSHWMDSPQGF